MSRTRKPDAPPPRATATGDAKALWEHVTASVRPLRGKKPARRTHEAAPVPPSAPPAAPSTAPAKSSAAKTAARAGTGARSATPQACTRDVTTTRPSAAVVPPPAPRTAGFDRATEDKLRKGKLAIEARIDLHGMTQDEAWQALTRFIARAARQHKRTVLVITGKGRVSTGGGILRRMVPLWVRSGDLATHVLACTPATIKDGGDGAFYLRLRKHV